ncbi:MAG: cobalamin biosynthesis protein CobU [Austwickia sp.]|nr:cobalamin biosynthesis protein CobU [Austwickia sp.]MBK9100222.1 cobalamin biosynthesis protein CobU [Austwickia sp.]
MEVLLLGTGSADGWPNAFCRCDSCTTQRAAGILRRPTSALIDGRILLDLSPHVGHAAQVSGRDLAGLDAVFVTHAHNDHCDPAHLFYRQWVSAEPLPVYGPSAVVQAIRPWLDPAGSAVSLHAVTVGDVVAVAGYVVRVLPADHHAFGEAVLYDVTTPRGGRLLYATDTGPWTPRCLDLMRQARVATGRAYDVVLLEETFGLREREPGHHDLASFAAALEDLRREGLIDAETGVVAVHLSHHNPPEGELTARLDDLGARPGQDLEVRMVSQLSREPTSSRRLRN